MTSYSFLLFFCPVQRTREGAVAHRVRGPCYHSLEEIQRLNAPRVIFLFFFYKKKSEILTMIFNWKNDWIIRLLDWQEEKDPESFSTFRERLHYLQATDFFFLRLQHVTIHILD